MWQLLGHLSPQASLGVSYRSFLDDPGAVKAVSQCSQGDSQTDQIDILLQDRFLEDKVTPQIILPKLSYSHKVTKAPLK